QTDGIVRTSTDAILMVEQDNGAIVFHNPVAEQLFELSGQAFAGRHLADLIDGLDAYQKTGGLRPGVGSEVTCRTAGGWSFPAEMAVTELRHGG
ncbi:MAG: PAS domain-containing protein, partial [Rhodospirillales bacterium]